MPRRILNPRYSSLSKARLEGELKRTKLAIEREKLCHLQVKTAQLPPRLTGRSARRPERQGKAASAPSPEVNIFERCVELSLSDPAMLPALLQRRRESGCDDGQLLSDALTAQCEAQLHSLGLSSELL